MGSDLRGALLKAGLVDKVAVERVEETKRKADERAAERAEKAASDRKFAQDWGAGAAWVGAKPRFYFWIRDRRVPGDVGNICCVCGKTGKSSADAALTLSAIMNVAGVDPLAVLRSGDTVAIGLLQGLTLGTMADVLYDFGTSWYPELEKLLRPGQRVRICGADRQKLLAPPMGP